MFTLPELYNGKKKKIVSDNGFDQAVTRTVSKEPVDMIITGSFFKGRHCTVTAKHYKKLSQ